MEDEAYKTVLEAVKECGNMIREAFRSGPPVVMTKSSDIDLVTEIDRKVETKLVGILKNKFPDHKFIGEEASALGDKQSLTDAPTWIIDPIDGTTNFVHKVPFICISIALYVNKAPLIGIVYNPVMEELFSARKGNGAMRNGFPIHASKTKELNKSLMLLTFGVQTRFSVPNAAEVYLKNNRKIVEKGIRGHRSFGSAALNLCYVALGCADGYLEFGLHSWDVAAGALIVQEAGGCVTGAKGEPLDIMDRQILATGTKELSDSISAIIDVVKLPRD